MSAKVDIARSLCFEMLTDVLEKQAYSNIVLQKSLRGTKLPMQDKNFAAALFYGTITRLYTLDYYLKRNLRKKYDTLDPAVHTLLRMGVWQLLYSRSVPPFAAVNETVKLARHHTNEGGVRLVNAVLRAVSQGVEDGTIDPEQSRFDVKYSLNRELSGCLIKWFGEEKAASIAAAFLGEPSVTARINSMRTTAFDLKSRLEEEGVSAEEGSLYEGALRLSLGGKAVYDLPSFQAGLFMIQDEAAMLAAHILSPKRGQRILDVCSAPGGKTCHIAELMGDEGKILALDLHDSRLEMVEQNQARLGLSCIDTAEADATRLREELPDYIGFFDCVLADVPCSGLGLLLRKPDIRFTMTYARMQELLPVQALILDEAAAFVRPGGTLVYSTCTINPHENGGQADRFLDAHPDFEAYPFDAILPEKPALRNSRHLQSAAEGRIQLLPDDDGCDGFFIARFRRKDI